ncbi:MAG: 5-formyltetrahydrofolate cyclo-ligase [Alphaproteobacteria bacterium]
MNEICRQKKLIRQQFLQIRKCFEVNEIKASQQLRENFIELINLQKINIKNNIFGSYLAINNEANCEKIENFIKENQGIICYPKINNELKTLDFIESVSKTELVYNDIYKKILEPKLGEILIPNFLFIPLVCFDKNLNRIGMGAGFYDRTIAILKLKNPKLKLIGIAYDYQFYNQDLPTEKTDQSLDFIVTNSSLFLQSKSKS